MTTQRAFGSVCMVLGIVISSQAFAPEAHADPLNEAQAIARAAAARASALARSIAARNGVSETVARATQAARAATQSASAAASRAAAMAGRVGVNAAAEATGIAELATSIVGAFMLVDKQVLESQLGPQAVNEARVKKLAEPRSDEDSPCGRAIDSGAARA